jgi:hypothetical protein
MRYLIKEGCYVVLVGGKAAKNHRECWLDAVHAKTSFQVVLK